MTTALVVVGWVAGALLLCRWPTLPAVRGSAGGRSVSVVVPARDEASSLPRLLRSVGPAWEVIVVDDESTDGTAAVATGLGARVVPSGGPPAGWTGKAWACDVGARAAGGDVVVLIDADTWFGEGGLDAVVDAHAEHARDGLLSVQPFHRTERAYEQASAVCNVVAVLASGVAAVVPPRSRRVAFGPCLVTTRAALGAVGGFASVAGDVVEDLALARRYEGAGRPVRCFVGGDAVRYRMYPDGGRSLVQGWTKNLAAGAARAPRVPSIGAALWVTGALSVGIAAVSSPSPAAVLAWSAYALQFRWWLRRLGSFRWWTWAVFPAGVAAFVLLVAGSLVAQLRGTARWRGRDVALRRG